MRWIRNGYAPARAVGVSLLPLLSLLLLGGCRPGPVDGEVLDGGADAGSDAGTDGGDGLPVEPACRPTASHERIPMRQAATRVVETWTFSQLQQRTDALCSSCHKAPELRGNFQYDTLTRDFLLANGALMADFAIRGAMPPVPTPEQSKQVVELGRALESWLQQGGPEGSFEVSEQGAPDGGITVAREVGEQLTDLGHCIPDVQALGRDPDKDAFFAGLTTLPPLLSDTDTDVVTFDARKLARHGTFAFVPTYPLFSDHAKKLRLVHVPAGQSIQYDAATKSFKVPPNTRFYKTFFKEVKDAQGRVGYRKMETRLIVVREPWNQSLFGSYIWNEEETVARLHDLRYRDGTPFPDRVLVYRTDEATGATRSYAVPGRHRCVDCHTGSEGQNFVLGFTPQQLNRREPGQGGTDAALELLGDERDQVDRLIRYGVLTGLTSSAELPRLEDSGKPLSGGKRVQPRNAQELELQGYYVGNCAHCHNPKGFAVLSNPAIKGLDFSAGGLFQFPTTQKESNGLRYYVNLSVKDLEADLRAAVPNSTLYQRVTRPTDERIIHMPANVPGQDCHVGRLTARWLASLDWPSDASLPVDQRPAAKAERLRVADAVSASCVDPAEVQWVAEDFTDKVPYEPRNPTWREHIGIAPYEYLTRYPITPAHEELARKLFPSNWWLPKPGCSFPTANGAPAGHDPMNDSRDKWMVDVLGNPRQPWGELYYSTPGATVFQGVCSNCHGRAGDGQSGAAKTLVALNGARVANLTRGLFGASSPGVPNRKMFEDVLGEHGGARYLLWMASGGTPVTFSQEFMQAWVKYGEVDIDFSPRLEDWGRWGANMLGASRGACELIRTGKFGTASAEPPSGNRNAIGGFRMWEAICTLDNPLTEGIRDGSDAASVSGWLQHAQFNAGVMAYFYLRDELSQGRVYPLRTECEKR
ncbi:hypothetical protein ACN28E_12560 [Archangium lansingense]|uniref:hypothetical protein n=1 Tax=Archangium lansingense TaxID=2995310 RepID=UPI003B75DE47